jgi:hypothetical protein
MTKNFLLVLAALLVTGTASAVTYDFQTDQSASFASAIDSSDNDAQVNYQYDYSTHVQVNGTQIPIPSAPNGTGTTGMRVSSNYAAVTADVDGILVYPDKGTVGTDWEMNFDLWINYNGDAAGGSASTNNFLFGATNSSSLAFASETAVSAAGDGFMLTMSGEGGSLQDYRFYSGTGTIARNDAGVTWFGTAGGNLNNLDQPWLDFFPDPDNDDTPTPTVGPFQTHGAPGKVWITVSLQKVGTTASIGIKRPSDTEFQWVGTATVPATATLPFVGYSDINTGVPTDMSWVQDQFAVVDNLVIQDYVPPSNVESWELY